MKIVRLNLLIVPSGAPYPIPDWKGVGAATYCFYPVWSRNPVSEDDLRIVMEPWSVGVAVTDTAESSPNEAALMALVEALQEVEDTHVHVKTNQEWLVKIIQGEFEPKNFQHLWASYYKIVLSRHLKVTAEHVPMTRPDVAGDARILKKIAKSAAERKGRELGHPGGGFDPL